MEKELMEAIAKHLPAMQMQVLREELEKVERIPKLEAKIVENEKSIREYREELSKTREKLHEAEKRALTTEELVKERFELDKIKLETQLQCANSRIYDLKELMTAAFRNPEIQKTFQKEIPFMHPNGYVQRETERHEETIKRF